MAAPALSVQGGQRDAIRKMLQLNRGGEADWDQATAQDDGTWKVLIYDKYCRDIISSLLYIQQTESPGGFKLGSLGPVAEGLFIWIFGISTLIGITVWITAKSN